MPSRRSQAGQLVGEQLASRLVTNSQVEQLVHRTHKSLSQLGGRRRSERVHTTAHNQQGAKSIAAAHEAEDTKAVQMSEVEGFNNAGDMQSRRTPRSAESDRKKKAQVREVEAARKAKAKSAKQREREQEAIKTAKAKVKAEAVKSKAKNKATAAKSKIARKGKVGSEKTDVGDPSAISASAGASPPDPSENPGAPSRWHTYTPSLLPPTISFELSEAVSHLSAADPRFGLMFEHLPCKPFQPPYTALDPFKTLVTSIIGQQVSWMAARAINGRFRQLFGYETEEAGFPGPDEVVQKKAEELKSVGLSLRKAEYVLSLSEHFLSGELSTDLLRDGTEEEIAKALIAVRGIGQWTVDMFLMFSLRRPDVLPVGDLGVQKGLLRWALAAHGALPKSTKVPNPKTVEKYRGKKAEPVVADRVNGDGEGEIDTHITKERQNTPQPTTNGLRAPPTPLTPNNSTPNVATLHTPDLPTSKPNLPPTPLSPVGEVKADQTLEVPTQQLPPPAPQELLVPPKVPNWDAHRAVPLIEGLSVETLKSRLSGKKAKGGAYLTPLEMEGLTNHWRPYRSLGVYYMWPAGEDF